ncbi:MAG TPA: hypothetical protein VKE94_20275, partial [Gemmataceae bacterium]|nr:hypothetical protein [Gemmataceae bacterium]
AIFAFVITVPVLAEDKASGTMKLFHGMTLLGWKNVLDPKPTGKSEPESASFVKDGIIVCKAMQ